MPRWVVVLSVIGFVVFVPGVFRVAIQADEPEGAPPGEPPIEVEGDQNGVDITVRSRRGGPGRVVRPPTPGARDVPPEVDGECVAPSASAAVVCGGVSNPVEPRRSVTTSVTAAREARARLRLPPPAPRVSPRVRFSDGAAGGLVGVPLWFWVDPTHWAPGGTPLVEHVRAGPVWATVTAAPVRQVWLPGDGATVRCGSSGTPLTDPARGLDGSPDCGHTYRRPSGAEPGRSYRVTVRIVWAVTWVGSDGAVGTLAPLVTETTIRYLVREARAQLVEPQRPEGTPATRSHLGEWDGTSASPPSGVVTRKPPDAWLPCSPASSLPLLSGGF